MTTAEAAFFQVLLVVFLGPVEISGSSDFRHDGIGVFSTLFKVCP